MITVTAQQPEDKGFTATCDECAVISLKSGTFLACGPTLRGYTYRQFGWPLLPGSDITMAAPGVLVFGSPEHFAECQRELYGAYD